MVHESFLRSKSGRLRHWNGIGRALFTLRSRGGDGTHKIEFDRDVFLFLTIAYSACHVMDLFTCTVMLCSNFHSCQTFDFEMVEVMKEMKEIES